MPHKRSSQGKQKQSKRFLTFEEKTAQKDTIRGIIKDNCRRDNVTGEIAFHPKDKSNIQSALWGEQFRVEKQITSDPYLERHLKVKTEKIWNPINQELAADVLAGLEAGEVLNRAVVPRWW